MRNQQLPPFVKTVVESFAVMVLNKKLLGLSHPVKTAQQPGMGTSRFKNRESALPGREIKNIIFVIIELMRYEINEKNIKLNN